MQDILKKYRKRKIFTNISLVLTSLVLAIWINITLIDGTEMWQNLKTSVLNSNIQKQDKSDIYLKEYDWKISLFSSKDIYNIKNLSFGLTYNPQNITIDNISSKKWEIINLNSSEWIKSIIINYNTWSLIKWWEVILNITANKKIKKSENINLINANFNDTIWKETYYLSTSWIIF